MQLVFRLSEGRYQLFRNLLRSSLFRINAEPLAVSLNKVFSALILDPEISIGEDSAEQVGRGADCKLLIKCRKCIEFYVPGT